jgi:hypothetical protein
MLFSGSDVGCVMIGWHGAGIDGATWLCWHGRYDGRALVLISHEGVDRCAVMDVLRQQWPVIVV